MLKAEIVQMLAEARAEEFGKPGSAEEIANQVKILTRLTRPYLIAFLDVLTAPAGPAREAAENGLRDASTPTVRPRPIPAGFVR
jgi:hypothetical protein